MDLKLLFACQLLIALCVAIPLQRGSKTAGRRQETLDRDGKVVLGWEAFTDTDTIFFDLSIETIGFVGFGISPVGGMAASDIVIGGVHTNGSAYFSDYHGIGTSMPTLDDQQDWVLLMYSQTSTRTILNFARLLNTCDDQDVAIGNDTTNFIWSYGETDNIGYHGPTNRGTYAANILDPPMPPFDSSNFRLWTMSTEMVMPSQKTTYWCTVQKSPPLASKHHIVGFRALLETEEALKHTHHFIVHKCKPPAGSSAEETFEHLVGAPGGECYKRSAAVPLDYCKHYLFVWSIGGKTVIYPDHVGYPVGTDGEPNYYLLEVHYDNPTQIENVRFETGLELFYTPQLRANDAGTITTGHETVWTITVPPKSQNYTIVGHCSPTCSRNIPESGIKVFNVLLHSHLAGRKMKLRHFRDGVELPWMAVDNNYNFDYQQNRPLVEERVILPGDHLTYECIYDNMLANGSVIGGLSTTEEMCNAFLWYYPDIGMEICSSEFPKNRMLEGLGISVVGTSDIEDPVIATPTQYAGMRYTEYLDTIVPWTPAQRAQIQEELHFGPHVGKCVIGSVSSSPEPKEAETYITYPEITEPYEPIDECANLHF